MDIARRLLSLIFLITYAVFGLIFWLVERVGLIDERFTKNYRYFSRGLSALVAGLVLIVTFTADRTSIPFIGHYFTELDTTYTAVKNVSAKLDALPEEVIQGVAEAMKNEECDPTNRGGCFIDITLLRVEKGIPIYAYRFDTKTQDTTYKKSVTIRVGNMNYILQDDSNSPTKLIPFPTEDSPYKLLSRNGKIEFHASLVDYKTGEDMGDFNGENFRIFKNENGHCMYSVCRNPLAFEMYLSNNKEVVFSVNIETLHFGDQKGGPYEYMNVVEFRGYFIKDGVINIWKQGGKYVQTKNVEEAKKYISEIKHFLNNWDNSIDCDIK